MNLEKTGLSAREKNQQSRKLEVFEKIKTPEELLSFMKESIAYGFVGRNSKRIFTSEKEMDEAWDEYYLQSPEEIIDSKHGVCWDMAEFEREWFVEHGYECKVFFMMFAKEGGTNLPTHTFLAYDKDKKWYWFEHSFGDYRGIHEYGSIEELVEDVKKTHFEHAVRNAGAKAGDLKCLRVCEYDEPNFGASPAEFVSKIIESNPALVSKENRQ